MTSGGVDHALHRQSQIPEDIVNGIVFSLAILPHVKSDSQYY